MSNDSTARPLSEEDVVEEIDDAGANQPETARPEAERRETGDVEQQKDAVPRDAGARRGRRRVTEPILPPPAACGRPSPSRAASC